MKTMRLKRIHGDETGTYGAIIDYRPFAVTLEDPWKDNLPNISCIPSGIYTCERIVSPKFGNTFQIMDVPNRTHILFHRGNTQEDTQGCILLGEKYEPVAGKPGIQFSGQGYREFMGKLTGINEFELVIFNLI